jgi:hypothetical protein
MSGRIARVRNGDSGSLLVIRGLMVHSVILNGRNRPIADLHKVEKPPVCMGFAGMIFQISNTTMTLHAREFE